MYWVGQKVWVFPYAVMRKSEQTFWLTQYNLFIRWNTTSDRKGRKPWAEKDSTVAQMCSEWKNQHTVLCHHMKLTGLFPEEYNTPAEITGSR